jgi:hypothetical protein
MPINIDIMLYMESRASNLINLHASWQPKMGKGADRLGAVNLFVRRKNLPCCRGIEMRVGDDRSTYRRLRPSQNLAALVLSAAKLTTVFNSVPRAKGAHIDTHRKLPAYCSVIGSTKRAQETAGRAFIPVSKRLFVARSDEYKAKFTM